MSRLKPAKSNKAAKPSRRTKAAAKPASSRKKAAAKSRAAKATKAVKPAKPTKAKASKPATTRLARSVADGPTPQDFKPYKEKRGEEYMNENQRQHFKNILLGWRGQLLAEVDRTVHHLQDDTANYPDPADRATQEEEFSLELRTRDRERKLIKKIDSTIEAIAMDEYGYCESCGIEIGIRRLEARPTANKCVDCKTLDEIKERQLGA